MGIFNCCHIVARLMHQNIGLFFRRAKGAAIYANRISCPYFRSNARNVAINLHPAGQHELLSTHQNIGLFFRQAKGATIYANRIPCPYFRSNTRNLAINLHPAGQHKLLSGATRRHTMLRQYFVNPVHHKARSSTCHMSNSPFCCLITKRTASRAPRANASLVSA